MKILFVSQSFYPYIGGVSTHQLNLACGLQENGHKVIEIHLKTSGDLDKENIRGISVYRAPKKPFNRKILDGYFNFKEKIYKECHILKKSFNENPKYVEGFKEYEKVNSVIGNKVVELLEKRSIEIVHVHDFQLLLLHKYVPKEIPLILTWHIPFIKGISRYLRNFLIRHMKRFDKVIFSTEQYVKEAIHKGLSKKRVEQIYPITNTNLFRPMKIEKNKLKEKYGIPKNSKTIVCVQRIDSKSGHEQLIKAFSQVLKTIPNVVLVFVGERSMSAKISNTRQIYEKKVHDLVKKLKLQRKVFFIRNIDYIKLSPIYNLADVVALTSKMEGFGLSVIEGMSCGKPIIGTNVGGIPVQVKDGINGYLVDVNDIETTAKKVIKLLQDKNLREKMGKESIKIVNKKFLMYSGIEKHLSLYNDLLYTKNIK